MASNVRATLHAEGFLLPHEVGAALGLHQGTIAKWARSGRISGTKRFGTGQRSPLIGIPKAELQRLLQENVRGRRSPQKRVKARKTVQPEPVQNGRDRELERLGAITMVLRLRAQLSALYERFPGIQGEAQAQIARNGLAAKK